ncbi:MAG: pilus assembly protein TadG-related protein, partial [Acidimicrobiales bacterium]
MTAPRTHRHRARERGTVIPLVAISLTVLMTFTALAVDLGRVSLERRDLQAVADTVALDMSRLITGEAASAIYGPAWDAALLASRERNHFPPGESRTMTATLGCYVQLTDAFDSTCPIPDSVQVVAGDSISYVLRPGTNATSRQAIASRDDSREAYFQIGSFLAALDPTADTAIGQILESLIPGATVLSYEGLLNASVTLEALGLNMPVTALSPDELLATEISMYDLVLASLRALEAGGGDTAAVDVLEGLLATAPTVPEIRLGDVLGIDATGGTPAGSIELDVLQLLTSSVLFIDGEHAISIPGTTLGIPGVGTVDVALTVIEHAQLGGPEDGASATTGQVKLTIQPQITISTEDTFNICPFLGDLLPALRLVLDPLCFLAGGLLDQVLRLQISATPTVEFTLASATGTQGIDCVNDHLLLDVGLSPAELTSATQLTVTGSLPLFNPDLSLGNLLRVVLDTEMATDGAAAF